VVKARVDKTFRAYDPRQVFLLPPSIDDWLPEGVDAGNSIGPSMRAVRGGWP
jgi:hypothetical protein